MDESTALEKLENILYDLLIHVEGKYISDKVREAIYLVDHDLLMDNPHVDCGICRNNGKDCLECRYTYDDYYFPKERA